MILSNILPNPDKKGKFDVYADGYIVMTLSEDAVVEAGLRIGCELDENRLLEIEHTAKLVKAKSRAYDLISYTDMSAKTLCDKLRQRGFEEEIALEAVNSLADDGYIDDERYAARLASYLANTKLFGRRRILAELSHKGVDREISEAAVDALDVDYFENICKLISKEKITDAKSRARVANKLVRYGYGYDMINGVIDEDE